MSAHSNLPPVLVIDDSPDDLILIKRLFIKAGVKQPVVTFDDSAKAMAFLKAAAAAPDSGLLPCVVFTDLKMPLTNGLELLRWIREQKRLADLPVVMLSGAAEEKDVMRAKTAGVTEYLVKLPKPDVIAAIIDEACLRLAKR
jgi:CheY-like chemotaxis protein